MTTTFRLPPDLQADLIWYWTEAESGLGVRSNLASQQELLLRRSLPEGARATFLDSLRATDGEGRRALARERKDAEVRALWQTVHVQETPGSVQQRRLFGMAQTTYEPDWASLTGGAADVRRRSVLVCAALGRLVRSAHGPRHQRVLFRVYGDPLLSLRQDELANLARYAKTPAGRRTLLGDASKAYAEAHGVERETRRSERRRRFDAIRGVAA